MRFLARLRRLPPPERRTALVAALLLPLAAASLRVLGCRPTLAMLSRMPCAAACAERDVSRTAAIVSRVAESMPGRPQCLVRSLVLTAILRRRGRDARLRLGVRRVDDALDAHAWVELEGAPVGDCPRVAQRFVPLVAAGADPFRA